MKLQNKTAAMLPLALALSATWATASEQYTTLETSIVSASGFEQDVREAPASVSVITSKELQSKPVSDIGSAIGDVPGVDIGLSKMGNSTVSIRGFDAAYTLMLVDGKRQNVSTAMMNNGFDPTSSFMPPIGFIDRIEVLRGPASVAWGSDAVGGVVNIITKRHPKTFTGSITVEGTLQQHDDLYGNSGGTSFSKISSIRSSSLRSTTKAAKPCWPTLRPASTN
ncbi:MAG: TonB-dependent receptor plug domain-containing protein [Sutterella sp.]